MGAYKDILIRADEIEGTPKERLDFALLERKQKVAKSRVKPLVVEVQETMWSPSGNYQGWLEMTRIDDLSQVFGNPWDKGKAYRVIDTRNGQVLQEGVL